MDRKFRYESSGKWFKGNTHLHSIASDGGKNFKELAEMYSSEGYDFLFRTDHWVGSDVEKDNDKYPLLWLDGIELDGQDHAGSYFHVVCLGKVTGLKREIGFDEAVKSAKRQGAITIIAHPHWCGNSFDDCLRWPFDGVEVYNHVCHWLNGKGNGLIHWDALLNRNPDFLAFSADDSHLKPEHPGWNGGWIAVNAVECSRISIMNSIRSGNFYSSCGPEIKSISFERGEIHVTMSPVNFARAVGPAANGLRKGFFDGRTMTSATFSIPDNWKYAYLELEDQSGRRAWTNNLFKSGK